ncbi:MAG: porin [Zoogloeaceae bacterium]|jgi:predicted porin|nr:porin [Zoogloeaceae bacterium]
MQKKLIAIAVAALASGAAFAQSTVTVYGVADGGLSYRFGADKKHDAGSRFSVAKDKDVANDNRFSIDTGISAGNRLGFKGVEDLGNGISALYTVELGFSADNGGLRNGSIGGRQAFLGLTGGFGTAIAGRLYTPHYTFLSTIDPFKGGTVGSYRNVFNFVDIGGAVGNVFDPTRVNNAVAYVSPSFSGFNVTAAYSQQAGGATSAVDAADAQEGVGNRGDVRVFALLPRYTNGPVDVGVSYHMIKQDKGSVSIVKEPEITNIAIGGTFDLGAVKIHAFYDMNELSNENGTDLKDDGGSTAGPKINMDTFLIGLSAPFGKHAVQLSYTMSDLKIGKAKNGTAFCSVSALGADNGPDALDKSCSGESSQFAIGYTYEFSKRTNFYAAYAQTDNDIVKDSDTNKLITRSAFANDNSNSPAGGYQQGFQLGIKHTF